MAFRRSFFGLAAWTSGYSRRGRMSTRAAPGKAASSFAAAPDRPRSSASAAARLAAAACSASVGSPGRPADDATIQRRPVSRPSASREPAGTSGGTPAPRRSSSRPGSKRIRCALWYSQACERRLAAAANRSTSLGEARRPAGRASRLGRLERFRHRLGRLARGTAAAAATVERHACRRWPGAPRGAGGAARIRGRREPAGRQLGRRRQLADAGEAQQQHLGRRTRRRALPDLVDALEQHLPGARQHRQRQALGQGPAALGVGGRRRPNVAAASGATLSRVSQWLISSRSCRHRHRVGAQRVQLAEPPSAPAASPAHHRSNSSSSRSRSPRPSMAWTSAGRRRGALAVSAIAWSSSESASRTEPSAARAIRPSASGSTATRSLAADLGQMLARRSPLDPAQLEPLAARQHRDRAPCASRSWRR